MKLTINFIVILSIAISITACKSSGSQAHLETSHSWGVHQLILKSKEFANQAQFAKSKSEKVRLTKQGMAIAEKCIMISPEEPGCYYYRAINTGLYYEAKVLGYQKGIKQMIVDCNKVITLDETYDYGGAYRILGELYTKLPKTTIHPEDIRRNLSKAESYLREAIRVSRNYPENHLLLCENLLAQGKIDEAIEALNCANKLTPQWKNSPSYTNWLNLQNHLNGEFANRFKDRYQTVRGKE